jgi:sRNA-binding carbon storage regulator CsrA
MSDFDLVPFRTMAEFNAHLKETGWSHGDLGAYKDINLSEACANCNAVSQGYHLWIHHVQRRCIIVNVCRVCGFFDLARDEELRADVGTREITLRVGDTVEITRGVTLRVCKTNSLAASLGITAPQDVSIWRTEIPPANRKRRKANAGL